MRVYDGESLKESDPKARSVQEYKDAAGVDEGMDGVSTRFAFRVLAVNYNLPQQASYELSQAQSRKFIVLQWGYIFQKSY